MPAQLSANCKVQTRNLQKLITIHCDQQWQLKEPLSVDTKQTLRTVQQRLMTYKELKLHEDMIALSEIEAILSQMSEPERDIAFCGVACIDFHIQLIDAWLEQHTTFA
ncbi:hypothetical protein [Vibrio ouci]|uniref:Uncharacterized protein n=1 Tax=Vibrio ouci TaxID=2499078 RepID=A0A4Y8WF78_9VIBR|nr:hypothetical protein [Vibrio ouci]TFH91557.1 hypothetical protein ELS82_10685 [Vibrio ouci]